MQLCPRLLIIAVEITFGPSTEAVTKDRQRSCCSAGCQALRPTSRPLGASSRRHRAAKSLRLDWCRLVPRLRACQRRDRSQRTRLCCDRRLVVPTRCLLSQVDEQFYLFLSNFLELHSRFKAGSGKSRPIFFTGESHAGHYIPSMTAYILAKNKASGEVSPPPPPQGCLSTMSY